MPTWLNVAEKPSVAREIAAVLSAAGGGGQPRTVASQSKYNPVFEFPFEGHTMLVTSVAGHLMEDTFPPNTRSWANFPFQDLFTAKISKYVKQELEPVQRNLEALAKKAATLVLWLDCDREGENICFEVIQVAQRQNSRLTDVRRAHFSALTQRDLLHAVHNLRTPDRNLSEAVEARQEMDLRIGAAFTRFQTVKFGSAFSGIPRVLSFGPCQFPTLGFVVERQWERNGFVPEDVFTIHLAHGNTRFSSSRGSMYDQVSATLVMEDMLEAAAAAAHSACVTRVQQRPNRRHPPVPLSTVVMQKLAATHLHISSERCMTLAEQLYQEGCLSYPRTETDSFSFQDSELLELVQVQTGNPVVGEYASAMLAAPQQRFRRPLRGGHDDKAHPPIHPTKVSTRASGTDDAARLYTLVARHFLACLSPDAVAATTSVTADYGGEVFTTAGTTIVERGYLDVFTYENWNSSCIPNYREGETFVPSDVNLEKTRTSPPPHLSESDLIALMDDNGIGTDATIAQHIKTVLDREYVKREGQVIVPTNLGIALAAAYEVLGLSSLLRPQLRAQMEAAMGDIAGARASKEQVVAAAVQLYREIFTRLAASSSTFYGVLGQYLQPAVLSPRDGTTAAGRTPATTHDTIAAPRLITCGLCGQPMNLVSARAEDAPADRCQWALQCTNATCGLRLPTPSGTLYAFADTQQKCALCAFNAIRATSREKSTSYSFCPHCFSHPPVQDAASLPDMEALALPSGGAGSFRCFQCIADCPLASGLEQLPITRCVSCTTHDLRLRSNANGCYLACKGYPDCTFTVTLPKATRVTPCPQQRCSACGSVLLYFNFSTVQGVPGMDTEEVACVSCDARLKDYITVKGFRGGQGVHGGAAATGARPDYALPSISASRADHRPAGGGAGAEVRCGCGQPAKRLVSRKETSRGKPFYTCAARQCNFFMWAE